MPVAGKTGTTNDNVDVWFVGMTPELVAGVWLGFDKPKTIASGAVGGGLAAPIWGQMIGRYYAGRSTTGWGPPPDGLVYAELDRDTGLLATPIDAARPAIHGVFPSGHRAGGAAQQSVEGSAVGSAVHADANVAALSCHPRSKATRDLGTANRYRLGLDPSRRSDDLSGIRLTPPASALSSISSISVGCVCRRFRRPARARSRTLRRACSRSGR